MATITTTPIPLEGGSLRLFSGSRIGIWILGVIVVLAGAELAARLIEQDVPEAITWYDASAQLRVDMLGELEADPQVAFAGTSMAWQAFVPDEFTAVDAQSRTAFNLGLAGAVPVVTEQWLATGPVNELEPDVLLWGVSSLDFSSSYGEVPLEAWDDSVQAREDFFGEVDRFFRDRLAIFRVREHLRNPDEAWGPAADARQQSIIDAAAITGTFGERRDFEVGSTETEELILQSRLADLELDNADLQAVLRTVEAYEARGVEVVLVELPVSPKFIELHADGFSGYLTAKQAINEVAEAAGVSLLDISAGYTDEDFVDANHLNEEAARRFTRELSSQLGQ